MNTNAASLDRLHDIVVPAPIPGWPPAPGWYWLLGFILIVVVALVVRGIIRWQHNRYRREALAELHHLGSDLKLPEQRAPALLALAGLLKRTALTAFPREQVATLTGTPWFEFLDRTGRGTTFRDGLGAVLENALYDPRTVAGLEEPTLEKLTSAVRQWIQHHSSEIQLRPVNETKTRPPSPGRPSSPSLQKRSA